MKKLLLINQPVANRGDESAHRGFVRSLLNADPEVQLTCLFVGEPNPDNIEQFAVRHPRVRYVNLPTGARSRQLSKLGLFLPLRWLWSVTPSIRLVLSYYREADAVVCAPGGADLGGFLSWKHLTYLFFARYVNRPLAYFGRSFGPLRKGGLSRWFFRRQSLDILSYMRFISLRDLRSQAFADELGVRYIPTVDSAFLEQPVVTLPDEVLKAINGQPYVVFVPNVLVWHYNFAGRIKREVIVRFFLQVARLLIERFPDHRILMLPQTFNGTAEQNDINFFHELRDELGLQETGNAQLVVLSDQYSSDLQQQIIRGARLLVGARYHSVVFSLNNATPFVGLSYEHKISGLLASLGKEDCMVDLIHGLDDEASLQQTLRLVDQRITTAKSDEATRKRANAIALNALAQFQATL